MWKTNLHRHTFPFGLQFSYYLFPMVQDAELCNKFHQQLRGMFSIQKDWLLKKLFKDVKEGNI